jgi:hypothetical protein
MITIVPAARSPRRWNFPESSMLESPSRKKNGTNPSTAPTRLRKTAWAPVIGTPRSETTRNPRARLPGV